MVKISSLLRRPEANPSEANPSEADRAGELPRDPRRVEGPDRSGNGTTYRGAASTDQNEDGATYRSATVTDGRSPYPDGPRPDDPRADDPQADPAERAATRRATVARAATGVTTAEPRRSGVPNPGPSPDRATDPDRDSRTDTPTDRHDTHPDSRTDTPTDRHDTHPELDSRPDTGKARVAHPTPEPAPVGPRPRASLLATFGLITGVAAALFVLTGALAGYGIALGALAAVIAVLGLRATRRRHVAGTTEALIGMLLGLGAVVVGVLAMTGQFDWPTTDGDWVLRFREWLDSQFVNRF